MDDELEEAMSAEVSTVLFDDEGKANVETILNDLADTEFAQEGLRRVLADTDYIEDWRVGEAIAEAYLAHHRSCHFPWPDGRDQRKTGSSLPGADLVGFGTDNSGDCLAFGEVKTSHEDNHPPSVVYGQSGLRQQMKDLRDLEEIRDNLLLYLGVRADSAPWRPKFQAASRRYLHNRSDFQLFGVLIRDVSPNPNDLRLCVESMAQDLPEDTYIEMLALYLPEGSIAELGKTAISKRKRATP